MYKNIIIGIFINIILASCTLEQGAALTGAALGLDDLPTDPTFNVWDYNVETIDESTMILNLSFCKMIK